MSCGSTQSKANYHLDYPSSYYVTISQHIVLVELVILLNVCVGHLRLQHGYILALHCRIKNAKLLEISMPDT